jgi:ankyrin repeat protein
MTPLLYAACNGHEGIVEVLLSSAADVNSRTVDGGTPLHYAAQKGHQGIVGLLLAGGADVNSRTLDGAVPLHLAAQEGHQGIVGQLLAAGASPLAQMESIGSPLLLAVQGDHAGVVQQLLDAVVVQQCEDGVGPSAATTAAANAIGSIHDLGTVFGPEVSKLPAVKAVLKERRLCSCCKSQLSNVKKYYKCSQCKLVYYCGPECQKQHWRNGHKEVCKAT